MAGTLIAARRGAARWRAAALVLPLAGFIGVAFLAPLATMLVRSVHDPVVADALPATLSLLHTWDGSEQPDGSRLPSEQVFAAAAGELVQAREQRTIGQIATRVNRVRAGLRSVITRSTRRLQDAETDSWRAAMVAADPAWGEPSTWLAVQRAGQRWTLRHYLNALDRDRGADGRIVRRPEEQRIYLQLFARTFLVSLAVTVLCLLLGYPLAYLIAHAPPRRAALLPFWTSLLVRTTSWIVLLQTQGVINDLLVALRLIGDEQRLAMVYNMTGTLIAMTHVLLPFMVLPLYSVMRSIHPQYLRAASSLGAAPVQAFCRVYWPLALPGVGAGTLLVFIVALGYYITPALVGGRTGQLISNLIAYHMQESLNWDWRLRWEAFCCCACWPSTSCTTAWWALPACAWADPWRDEHSAHVPHAWRSRRSAAWCCCS